MRSIPHRNVLSLLICSILTLAGPFAGEGRAGSVSSPAVSPPAGTSVAASPQSIEVYNPAGVRADGVFIDKLLARTKAELGKTRPARAGDFPEGRVERVAFQGDAFATVNDLFYKRGWTDGLPIVPPTKERVLEMLKGADLDPDFVVARLDPMDGQATVEKIAVNAVMAGCRPEYMPILMAAVEALQDPAFDLRGMATTTNPDTPMMIISGPIVRQLDLNAGTNTLGRGWKANATLGRALHLIIQNIGGSWPGITDMSCFGQPGEFAMCMAENEAANPWMPLHMELGHPKAANVVTLFGAEGTQNIRGIGQNAKGYLRLVADALAGADRPGRPSLLLMVAQDTAAMLAREGWERNSIREFILENARIPYSRYKEKFIDTRTLAGVPPSVYENKGPRDMIRTPFVGQFLILVAGGPGEKSMVIPGWSGSRAVSREIRLPANWEELLAEADQEGAAGAQRK